MFLNQRFQFNHRLGNRYWIFLWNALFVSIIAAAVVLVPANDRAQSATSEHGVRNFIFMIGDGMGFEQLASGRLVKGERLVMDCMPIRHRAETASASHSVTDSAAGATALATGVRTTNRFIGLAPDGEKLTSILTLSQRVGKATGVVVTDMLYGATPGAFIAHAQDRDDHDVILEQAIFHTQPDVMLGGGVSVFNQIRAWQRLDETDYGLITTRDELLAWNTDSDSKLLGLFANSTMAYEVDRTPREPHISEMTRVALDILSREENGFFLLIEGSRIDHAGHANDLRRSVHEVIAFDEAIRVALQFASERDDTVIIITADHETGGLTSSGSDPAALLVKKGIDEGQKAIEDALEHDPDADLPSLLAEQTYFYTTTGHTSAAVPVFAYGPGSERFLDIVNTADIGRVAIDLLGVQEAE